VQIGLEMVGEFADHGRFLGFPQQAVVDQDARELFADGFGQQGRHDRRIDPA